MIDGFWGVKIMKCFVRLHKLKKICWHHSSSHWGRRKSSGTFHFADQLNVTHINTPFLAGTIFIKFHEDIFEGHLVQEKRKITFCISFKTYPSSLSSFLPPSPNSHYAIPTEKRRRRFSWQLFLFSFLSLPRKGEFEESNGWKIWNPGFGMKRIKKSGERKRDGLVGKMPVWNPNLIDSDVTGNEWRIRWGREAGCQVALSRFQYTRIQSNASAKSQVGCSQPSSFKH